MVVAVEMMIACPRCNGRLRLEQESGQPDTLICMACSREFPSPGALIKSPSGGVAVDYAKPKAAAAPRVSKTRTPTPPVTTTFLTAPHYATAQIEQDRAVVERFAVNTDMPPQPFIDAIDRILAPTPSTKEAIETVPVVFEVKQPEPPPPQAPPPPEVFRNVHFKILMKSAAEYAQFMEDCDDKELFPDERIAAIRKAAELGENRVAEQPEDALKRMIAEAEAALKGIVVQFIEVSERKKEAEKRLVGLTKSLAAYQETMVPGSMKEAARVDAPATREAVEYIKEWAEMHRGMVRVSDLAAHMAAMKGDPSKKSACENNIYRALRRLGYILVSRGFWSLP